MQVLNASESPFPNCNAGADWFPQPQITTMTIARSNSISSGCPQLPKPTMMRSISIGSNPMMRVTLPKEFGDDPLASPIGIKPLHATFEEPGAEPAAPVQPSTGFANVFTRRRQSSIEKKPPMVPMAPSLRRTTSVPVKASNLVSKMAKLTRSLSGGKSRNDNVDEDDEEHGNARESLLMLLRVPDVQRHANVPLMMAGDLDY